MARSSRKKRAGESLKKELSRRKGTGKLVEEIIRESLNPDCNRILLEGKIKELEDSGKNYQLILMKSIRQRKAPEQKVVFGLLVRKKSRETIKNLKKIVQEDLISIKIRRLALIQLEKWGENIDEALLKLLEEGEEIISAIEKSYELSEALEERISPSIIQKFSQLPKSLKVSSIKQILDDFPNSSSLVLKLIQGEGDLDEKVVSMLATIGTLEIGDLFARVLVETKNKNLRRLLKRHLFQMKNRGLEVVIPKIEAEEPPKFLRVRPSQADAYITSIDYLGERLVFLSKSVLGWGVVFFQITLSDQEGIKNFNAFDLNRKEIKNFLNRISEDSVFQLIDIDPAYCYFLIDEAYQINLNKGIAPPEQFSHWKAEIDDLKGKITEPIIYSFIPQEAVREENLSIQREKYITLFELEEFKEWFLEPRLLWDYIEKYKEVETSPLVLSPYQIEERKESILTEAAQKIFASEFRQIYKRRLEEMAYILFRTDKNESAMLTIFAAADLRADGIPSEKHGFLYGLVKKSIVFYLGGRNAEQEDRFIITPR